VSHNAQLPPLARHDVDAIWEYFLMIWIEWNGELYGKDYDEQQA
jgi:hypothetical protein